MKTLPITLACAVGFALCFWSFRSKNHDSQNSKIADNAASQLRLHELKQAFSERPSPARIPKLLVPSGLDAPEPYADPTPEIAHPIIEQYLNSQKQDLDARWAMIETLSRIDTLQSANFLAAIALEPLSDHPPAPPLSASDHTHGCNMGAPSDQMLDMAPREWSAAAIVRMSLRNGTNAPHFNSIVTRVLEHAPPQVSKYAAMTLFSHDALTPQHKSLLDARGVFHNFRFLSANEQQQLFRSDKIALAPQDQ